MRKRNKKRMAAVLLAATVGISCLPTGGITVSAAEESETRVMELAVEAETNDFSYQELEDGTIEITGYSGSGDKDNEENVGSGTTEDNTSTDGNSPNNDTNIEKKSNKVTVSKTVYSLTASAKNQSIASLGANATGGTITYASNNKNVTVTNQGKVTIAKNFVGTAKITVTAQSPEYETATATVTVQVAKVSQSFKNAVTKKTVRRAKKAQSFRIGAKATGKVTYKVTKKDARKVLTVSKTGKVTIKKNAKVGTYTVKVKATAAAKGIYKKTSKTYTIKVTVGKKKKQQKATKYNYEVKFLNQPYTELDTIVYIKTNNPSAKYFSVKFYDMKGKEAKANLFCGVQYDDIKYRTDLGICKVKGGYLDFYELEDWKAGKYKVVVEETDPNTKKKFTWGQKNPYETRTDDLGYIDVKDYKKEKKAWMRSVIKEATTSSMTKKEKMKAITHYMYEHSLYTKTIYSKTASHGFRYVSLAAEEGVPFWKFLPYEFNSYTSPAMLVQFGDMIGYPLKSLYGKYYYGTPEWSIWHMKAQSVKDGSYYQFCHVEDNRIDKASIKQINLSTWNFYECYK